VKNGRGAIETSSSNVTTAAVGDPRDDVLDNVGLEILAPPGPNANLVVYGNAVLSYHHSRELKVFE